MSLIAGIASSESRTEKLPVGQLQVLGIGVESVEDGQSDNTDERADTANGQLSATELEKQQRWWRWALLAGLALLIIESLWASSIEKRQAADAVS